MREELHWLAIIWFITLLLEWKLDIKRLSPRDFFLGQAKIYGFGTFLVMVLCFGGPRNMWQKCELWGKTPQGLCVSYDE